MEDKSLTLFQLSLSQQRLSLLVSAGKKSLINRKGSRMCQKAVPEFRCRLLEDVFVGPCEQKIIEVVLLPHTQPCASISLLCIFAYLPAPFS